MTNPPPPTDDDSATTEVDALRAKLEETTKELERMKDLAARAQADLQNARARMERDADQLRAFAGEQTIRRILPALDNFQRAFQHVPAELANHEWVKGVAAVEQALLSQLQDQGLTRMASLGQKVDPSRHEIIIAAPGEMDTVVQVLDEGYELSGKVLRAAKVAVGNGEKA